MLKLRTGALDSGAGVQFISTQRLPTLVGITIGFSGAKGTPVKERYIFERFSCEYQFYAPFSHYYPGILQSNNFQMQFKTIKRKQSSKSFFEKNVFYANFSATEK